MSVIRVNKQLTIEVNDKGQITFINIDTGRICRTYISPADNRRLFRCLKNILEK